MPLLSGANRELVAPPRYRRRRHRALLSAQDILLNRREWIRSAMISKTNDKPESKSSLPRRDQSAHDGFGHISNEEHWPGIDSRYRLIVVAALRSKQLLRGATPRIDADPLKRRNTSIAIEEVKRGLVPFTITTADPQSDGHGEEETAAEGLQ